MKYPTIRVLSDAGELAAAAAELIVGQSERAIADRGSFHIALSGGNTPKVLYELLASDAYLDEVDWPHWHVYFGDERCVGPDHPDSNYRMARAALFDHVPLDGRNLHRMKGEIDPQQAAGEYDQLLKDAFADAGLDLILLGLGDDGHTASLFPGTAALSETHRRCVANFVPKLDAWRLTLTAPFINRARQVVVLVSGEAKAKKVTEVLEGPRDPQRLPIQLIQPQSGELLWLLDAPAAGMTP